MHRIYIRLLSLVALQCRQGPTAANDYSRSQLGGIRGKIVWESLLEGDGLDGWTTEEEDGWTREGNTIVVNSGEEHHTRLVRGYST